MVTDMLGDRHLHTHFSCDSDEKTENVIERAIALGMKEICITDHCDIDLGPLWYMPVREYAAEMERLRDEYKDRIQLHIGIEMGLNPEYNEQIKAVLDSYPFELVIGSIHTMQGDDPYYREHFKMDDREFYRVYFETALERLKNSGGFNVFGHFDYVVRYGEQKGGSYDPREFADVIDEILKELISRNIALELNTGGLRKGIDFVHPHEYILTRYRELGGRLISIGSDAHLYGNVGTGFEKAEEVMKAFGFSENDITGWLKY